MCFTPKTLLQGSEEIRHNKETGALNNLRRVKFFKQAVYSHA
jgi:hypothetical protein